jgi:phenylpropionate dioxygenase-like ring-hydroxylating dioxygenase large terminal subunit
MKQVSTLGLDRQAYFSQEWFDDEQAKVFSNNWSFAGVLSDIPHNGDYICVNVGRNPLFVIRDLEGTLRAFHNICRHRGTVMLRGKGNVSKNIQCPYHFWSYELTGKLYSVTQQLKQFAMLDKSVLSLHPASIQVFKGMIFVHPNPDEAQNFWHWLGQFKKYLGPYDLRQLEELYTVCYPMRANWKLFIENHIESYHLWYAHKNSILGLDHEKQVNHFYNGHWSFFQPTIEPGKMAEFEKHIPARIIAPNEKWFGSGDHMLYPNLGLVSGAKFFATLKVIPLTPTTSDIEIRVFGKPLIGEEPDPGEYYEKSGSSAEFNINLEDIDLCERVQEGVFSNVCGVGALARDYEQSIRHFHDKYRSEMLN